MENEMMNMIKKISEQMNQMHEENKEFQKAFDDFTGDVKKEFDGINQKLDGIGKKFEESTDYTIQTEETLDKKIKYLRHKVSELEEVLFFLNPKH